MRRTAMVWLILSMAVLLGAASCSAPDNRVHDSAASVASYPDPSAIPNPGSIPNSNYPPPVETRPALPGAAYPNPLTELLSRLRPGAGYPPPSETRPHPSMAAYIPPFRLSPTPTLTPTPIIPPPPPALPWSEALQRFTGNALLYQAPDGFLMLTNPDGTQQLWLNMQFCPSATQDYVYSKWSSDGQFLALVCRMQAGDVDAYIINMQSGDVQQVAHGVIIGVKWAPSSSRLLVSEQLSVKDPRKLSSGGIRAFIVEAATVTHVDLPVAPFWYPVSLWGGSSVFRGYDAYALLRDPGQDALMDWSPDGTRIVIANTKLYVVDADGTNLRELPKANDPQLYTYDKFQDTGYFGTMLGWSRDGTAVLLLREVYDTPLTHVGASVQEQPIHVALDSGAVELLDWPFRGKAWSPDGNWYTTAVEMPRVWLHRADGTPVHQVTQDAPDTYWTPDSQMIIFEAEHLSRSGSEIRAYDVSGREETIYEVESSDVSLPHTSQDFSPLAPNGLLLAVLVREPGSGNSRLVIVDRQG